MVYGLVMRALWRHVAADIIIVLSFATNSLITSRSLRSLIKLSSVKISSNSFCLISWYLVQYNSRWITSSTHCPSQLGQSLSSFECLCTYLFLYVMIRYPSYPLHIDIYLTIQLDVKLMLPNRMYVLEINTKKTINVVHNWQWPSALEELTTIIIINSQLPANFANWKRDIKYKCGWMFLDAINYNSVLI